MASDVHDWKTPFCILRLEVDLTEYSNEPSAYVRTYEGKLLSGEDDIDEVVGELTFSVVELSRACCEGVNPWDVLDSIDQALAHFMVLVTNRGWVYVRSVQRIAGEPIGCLLVLDRLSVVPSWRGRGLGLSAINIACDRVGNYCSLAALRAFPTQWEGRDAANPTQFRRDRAKLMDYYRRAAFEPVLGGGLMVRGLPGTPWR
jgi:hypothetical protein